MVCRTTEAKRKAVLFLVTYIATILSAIAQVPEVNNTRIELVQVLFRHGDRSAYKPYPTDKYQEPQWAPYGLGNLTDVGPKQAFDLGRYLRDRYVELNLGNITEDQVYVRSTYYLRTQMTANCVMAGMRFPDNITSFNPWNETQPIPVHFESKKNDQIFGMSDCPTLGILKKKWKQSFQGLKDFKEKNKDLFEELSKHVGMTVNETNIVSIADAVFCETHHNMKQPPWMVPFVPRIIQLYWDDSMFTTATEIQRLRTGPLLENMVKNIYATAHEKTHAKKLYVYSGHDSTLSSFLSLLGIHNDLRPPYTACVMVELHKQDKISYIKILYRNNTEEPPITLKLPGCEELCPRAKFLNLVKNLTLRADNRASECGPVYGSVNPGENIIPLTIAGILVLFVVIGGIAFILKRRRLRNAQPMNYRQLLQDSESNLLDSDDDEDELL